MRISSAVVTGMISQPVGAAWVEGAEMRMTRRARGVAGGFGDGVAHLLPLERLPIKRTGSMGSRGFRRR